MKQSPHREGGGLAPATATKVRHRIDRAVQCVAVDVTREELRDLFDTVMPFFGWGSAAGVGRSVTRALGHGGKTAVVEASGRFGVLMQLLDRPADYFLYPEHPDR